MVRGNSVMSLLVLIERVRQLTPGEAAVAWISEVTFDHGIDECILSLRCGRRHQRIDANVLECPCYFAHLCGAAASVLGDAADQIVRQRPLPAHLRIARV